MEEILIDLATLGNASGFTIQGDAAGDNLGIRVSAAGDFNNDGFDDLILGTPEGDDAANRAGEAYLIFGKGGTDRSLIDLSNLSASDGFVIRGDSGGALAGYGVASADINGDGYSDIIVGVPQALELGDPVTRPGKAYVILGGPGATHADVDLANFSSTDGFVIVGEETGDNLGWRVEAAGDVNGDGVQDLLASAPYAMYGTERVGKTYVIFGKTGARSDIDLSNLASTDGFVIVGEGPFGKLGIGVAGTGDVNGDDIDDIVVGDNFQPGGGSSAGGAYVIYGQMGMSRDDVLLSNLTSTQGFFVQGDMEFDNAGIAVSAAGDINDDQINDILIAAIRGDDSAMDSGEAYIIYGKAGPRGDIDLSSLDASDGFIIQGSGEGDLTGFQVAYAGDVNRDGIDDVAIAAPFAQGVGEDNTGAIYIIFGKEGSRGTIDLGNLDPSDGVVVRGIADGDSLGSDLFLAGDINGDGFLDLVMGAGGNDSGGNNAGQAYVIFGTDGSTQNAPPVAVNDSATTAEDTPVTINLIANDSDGDGDALTVTPGTPANGTVSVNGDGTVLYTPAQDFFGQDSFAYTLSDGQGGTATATVSVTVTAVNDAPVPSSPSQSVSTGLNEAKSVTVSASDADGDNLEFNPSEPGNGTVTGGTGGQFVYTPNTGFSGEDSFVVTITDGNGGTATQTVNLTVGGLPSPTDFSVFASDGFAGAFGGSGTVFGTIGFQDITVIDAPGIIALDPSFNRGNDVVRLSGDADSWTVARAGSSAIFSDGDTFVQISVGSTGMAVVFDDGARTLRFDSASMSFQIGSQSFAAQAEQITAGPDGTIPPTGADPQAQANQFLAEGAGATAGGRVNIFGTTGAEPVSLLSGNITLDPSFNRGGDSITFQQVATDFTANRVGSSVILDSATTEALIPVGSAGATLIFSGNDERTLVFDGGIQIGGQLIGADPVQLAAA